MGKGQWVFSGTIMVVITMGWEDQNILARTARMGQRDNEEIAVPYHIRQVLSCPVSPQWSLALGLPTVTREE